MSSVLGDLASQTHLPAVVTARGPACSRQPASPSRRTGLWQEGTRDRKPCWSLGCLALRSVTAARAVLSGLELVGVEGGRAPVGGPPPALCQEASERDWQVLVAEAEVLSCDFSASL